MILYLDASVLIALFVQEQRTHDAEAALPGKVMIVSDLSVAEFSSGIGRRVRMGEVSKMDATSIFGTFDAWSARGAQRAALTTGDMATALGFIRRIDLGLRAPDALNIAIAGRHGAALFTFDTKMAAAATALGVDVI